MNPMKQEVDTALRPNVARREQLRQALIASGAYMNRVRIGCAVITPTPVARDQMWLQTILLRRQ